MKPPKTHYDRWAWVISALRGHNFRGYPSRYAWMMKEQTQAERKLARYSDVMEKEARRYETL